MQDLAAFTLKTQFFLLHCRRHAVTSRILFVLKVVSLLAFLLLFSAGDYLGCLCLVRSISTKWSVGKSLHQLILQCCHITFYQLSLLFLTFLTITLDNSSNKKLNIIYQSFIQNFSSSEACIQDEAV